MVIVEQYPDTITHQNENGQDVKVKCRFYPDRGTRFFKKQDGTEVMFKHIIAFPLGTKPILSGTIIDGQDKDGYYIVYQQEFLEFHPGQLHCTGKM